MVLLDTAVNFFDAELDLERILECQENPYRRVECDLISDEHLVRLAKEKVDY